MAIKLDLLQSNYGIPFMGAYFRVMTSTISRTREGSPKFIVMIDVCGYGAHPQNEDTKEVDFRRYIAPYEDVESRTETDFIGKCYQWVMSQPDMAGSIAA